MHDRTDVLPAVGYALLACLMAVSTVRAQATPSIPPTDHVYADLDRLAALGLIDDMVTGQRPYTENEILRLLREAGANTARAPRARDWAERVIALDTARLALPRVRVVEQVDVTATHLHSPFRAIPADANGSVDASINPLVAFSGGRRFAGDGGTFALETRHSALVGNHAAVWLNPRMDAFSGHPYGPGGTTAPTLRLQSGGVNLLFGNFSVTAGRDYRIFAQSPTGGIILSNNAPPFDGVAVANQRPARLPGFLGAIGLAKATLLVADLGPHDARPHAKLVAYKLSARITPHVEFGIQVVDETGGSGAPPATFGQRIVDVIPPLDILSHSNSQFSNKMAGMDLRVHLPSVAGLELYADAAVDDMDYRRFYSSFIGDGGIVGGFAFSCLLDCGRTTLRAEYRQTGIRYYTHFQFPSGFASNETLWGDPLGPRGLGWYGSVDHDAGSFGTVLLGATYEIRSGNLYGSVSTEPDARDFHFVRIWHAPGETRRRFTAAWESPRRARGIAARVALGYERVTDYGFTSGVNRSNALVQTGIEWRP